MSDFTSNFWSVYVAGLTLVSILACVILLWVTGRKKMPATADNSTGHVWDEDLREMNNPLPRWWVWMFIITIVFSLLYLVAYPGLGDYKGQFGWSSTAEHANELLEERVAQKSHELGESYERLRASEAARTRAEERARISREMHDGIGGQLMTALRGVERGAFSQERLAELLQESLDDLRLIIDATAADVSTVLGYTPAASAAAVWATVITGNETLGQAGGALNVLRAGMLNRLEEADGNPGTLKLYKGDAVTLWLTWQLRDKSGGAVTGAAGEPARRAAAT